MERLSLGLMLAPDTISRPPFSSSFPQLESISFYRSFPSRNFQALGITVTELLLGHVVDAMQVPWNDIRDMLQSFPLLISLRLGGIACTDIPEYSQTKILFAHLKYLDFVFSSAPMIDILASIHTPVLRGMHLDALSPDFNYHFISKCGHLLSIPLRLSVKFADAFLLEDITDLINSFTSITRLDVRRQGLRGEVVVTDMLMSGDLLLDDLEDIRVEWPISEATLQIIFAHKSFYGRSITSRVSTYLSSSDQTMALRNGSIVEVVVDYE
jgi:hypothetical protein